VVTSHTPNTARDEKKTPLTEVFRQKQSVQTVTKTGQTPTNQITGIKVTRVHQHSKSLVTEMNATGGMMKLLKF
jgi:hypothetical protein